MKFIEITTPDLTTIWLPLAHLKFITFHENDENYLIEIKTKVNDFSFTYPKNNPNSKEAAMKMIYDLKRKLEIT